MSFLTKLFLLLFICWTTLGASVYDNEILTMFANIAPRMVLMSNQKDRIKGSLEICIVNDKTDEATAMLLIDKMHDAYPKGIINHPLKLTNSSYDSIHKCQNSQLIFLLNTNDHNIEKTLKYSREHRAMSIAYDPAYLENGIHSSLFIGRKVTPYLNIDALQKSGIEIDNLLIRISKIYLNDGENK